MIRFRIDAIVLGMLGSMKVQGGRGIRWIELPILLRWPHSSGRWFRVASHGRRRHLRLLPLP